MNWFANLWQRPEVNKRYEDLTVLSYEPKAELVTSNYYKAVLRKCWIELVKDLTSCGLLPNPFLLRFEDIAFYISYIVAPSLPRIKGDRKDFNIWARAFVKSKEIVFMSIVAYNQDFIKHEMKHLIYNTPEHPHPYFSKNEKSCSNNI